MKLLEDMILERGKVLPGHVLKVDSFLNHQIDVRLLKAMADELYKIFSSDGITKVLTVEASGIAIATMVAARFDVPLVFAKKHKTSNVVGDVYSVHGLQVNFADQDAENIGGRDCTCSYCGYFRSF